jgi:phage terminase large subunit-like protein
MAIGQSESNWLVIPPTPPHQWWLEPEHTGMPESPELRELQRLIDENEFGGRPLTDGEYRQYMRLRAERDLFFLGKFVLGFDRLQGELHHDLAYAWQCPDGTQLTRGAAGLFRWATIPRGHLKSTLLTIAWTIFLLIRDHDERILIYSASYTIAKKIFGQIKALLEGKGPGGKTLLECFPELSTTNRLREKWAENMLTIPRETPFSDHSVECTGIGGQITGSHFTTENVDDAVGKLENAEQMAKILDTLNNLDPLLDSFETGKRRMVCTPWGFWDPAARAERQEPEALVCRRSMFEEPDPTAPQGRRPITDPQRFTYERLVYRWKPNMDRTIAKAKQIARQTPYFFSCQFSCMPRREGTIGFKPEWFRRFVRRGDLLEEQGTDGRTVKKVPLAACNVFVIADPIGGDKRGTHGPLDPNRAPSMDSDYVGIAVVAINDENMKYVLEIQRRRYNDDEFQAAIFELVARYHPRSVHIEATGGQRHIFKGFRDAWKRGKPTFVLGEWTGGRASKPERIRGLIPMIAEGFMLFRAEAPPALQDDIEGVIQTLLDGDSAQHDDDADALSAIQQIGYPPTQNQDMQRQLTMREFGEEDELLRLDPTSRWAWEVVRKKSKAGGSIFGLGEGFNSGGANA